MSKPKFVVIEADVDPGISPREICFSKDGTRIIGVTQLSSNPERSRFVEWDASTGHRIDSAHAAVDLNCRRMLASPKGDRIALLGVRRVELFESESLRPMGGFKLPGELFLGTLVWSPEGHSIAVNAPKLAVWDLQKGVKLSDFEDDMDPLGFTSKAPVEVLVGGDTGVWKIFVPSGKRSKVAKMPREHGFCWSHGFAAGRQTLLSLSERGRLLQTDLGSGETIQGDGPRSSCGHRFAFTSDGGRAAIWGSSGALWVWDVAAGRPLFKWSREHFHQIECACFSIDGLRLAVSLEGRVHVLDFREDARGRVLDAPQMETGLLRCVEMIGAEQQMDQRGLDTPLNQLPVKCVTCGMLDLDFVGDPYLVGRGHDKPGDLSMAAGGNFFVREPVMRILEMVAPGQCTFVPTRHSKTGVVTDWGLAIPNHQQITATPPTERERCPSCGEPWCFHCYSESRPGEDVSNPASTRDVFKARQWSCHLVPFKGWGKPRPQLYPRQLYFSVRLEQLLKKLKLRGLSRSGVCKAQPDAADTAWVEEQLRRIHDSQAPLSVAKGDLETALGWLADYAGKRARKGAVEFDFDALERRENCRLPASYREFASRLGRKRFGNFQGEEGLTVTLLPPGDLDFAQFANSDCSEGQPGRAVVFGTLNNGNVLCFDLARQDPEIPVYHYDHESDDFEPFAPNFPACIRRLVEG